MAVHDHTVRTCSAEGCGRPHDSHGYCSLHSKRLKRHGSLTNPVRTPKPFEKCSVDGCDSKVHAHGMCGMHAQRMRRYGRTDFAQRSFSKAYFESCFDRHEDGCWLWKLSPADTGYAHFCGKLAHRVSYQFYKGNIPRGLVVMHSCDVRHCVNPDHLSLGTHKMNTQDMMEKNRNRSWSPPRGIDSHLSKFSAEDVDEIKRLYSNGLSMREIARKFSVHHRTISTHLARAAELPMTTAEASNSEPRSLAA
jgi:hypothetical protein